MSCRMDMREGRREGGREGGNRCIQREGKRETYIFFLPPLRPLETRFWFLPVVGRRRARRGWKMMRTKVMIIRLPSARIYTACIPLHARLPSLPRPASTRSRRQFFHCSSMHAPTTPRPRLPLYSFLSFRPPSNPTLASPGHLPTAMASALLRTVP